MSRETAVGKEVADDSLTARTLHLLGTDAREHPIAQ